MEMLAVLLVCLLVAAIVMPWVNLGRSIGRGREMDRLKQEVARLSRRVLDLEGAKEAEAGKAEFKELRPVAPPPIPKAVAVEKVAVVAEEEPEAEPQIGRRSAARLSSPKSGGGEAMSVSREDRASQDWFGKLAVWVGGVALLMAGFYMVKYSIDSGWLTPPVRVWTTAIFGALLCMGGFVMGLKSNSPGNLRIGQALTGAGVACLYFAVYASVNLYGFVSSGVGFAGMVGVTVLAVALSLRHGAPIALMGFVGGFLTPMLMGDFREDTVALFAYLFLLFGAAQFLCVKRGWWGLFLGSLLAAYVWSAGLLLSYGGGYDVYPEGALLFILGICGLNAALSLLLDVKGKGDVAHKFLWLIRVLAWCGGLLQALILVCLGGFEVVDMALFAVLSFGALALAVLREETFAWSGWLAFCAMLVGSLANPESSLLHYSAWPVAVALVFFLVSHCKALHSEQPSYWRGLSLSALIMMLLVVFVNRECVVDWVRPVESFWLWIAVAVAGVILLAAEHLKRLANSDASTVAGYSAAACFVVGFGLWDYLPASYLSAGVAGLLFVAGGYWKVRQLARVELVLGVLIAAWLVTMIQRIGYALDYLLHFEEFNVSGFEWSELGTWYLGVGVLALVLRWFGGNLSESIRKCGNWLLGLVGLLALVTSYQCIDLTWLSNWWSDGIVEGGLTALLAVLALGALIGAKRWPRGLSACWLLSGLVGYRIVVMHLFDRGAQGDSFFLNALLWQFGVPLVAVFAMAWVCRVRELVGSARAYQIAAMLLGFVWATFLVQDYSGSSRLFAQVGTSTEMYTYSVVWLLLAVVYQAMGLWRGIKTLHIGSLILLLLTVGKVFLVDASELEGLYRVLSFLGLGVALIGIGFFYNKVVFGRGCAASEPSVGEGEGS